MIKEKVERVVRKCIKDIYKKNLKFSLEVPKGYGDFALPCFVFAKELKKNPVEIAKKIGKNLKGNIIEKVSVDGAYVNIFVKNIGFVLKSVDNKFGSAGRKGKVLLEHTSVNPNASPHVGRARNAIIGDSLKRVLEFQGYKVEVHYYVNDIGKQIAMLVYAVGSKVPKFEELLDVYVKINKKVSKDGRIEEKIFELLRKVEDGDKKVLGKFRKIVDSCIKGQKKILSELGIEYDYFDYESDFLKTNSKVLKMLEKTGRVFDDSDGRKILNQEGYRLPMKVPYLVLTRNDDSSLYIMRDIGYTLYKMNRKVDRNIVLLGEDHKLYFQQLSLALEMIGSKSPEVIHYSHVLLKEGKMSTRKGSVVLLSDFMSEIVDKASKELKKRYKKVDSILAKQIGYGALKYAILRNSPEKNIIFDISKALSFEGESAPYIQYAHARGCSILREGKILKPDYNLLVNPLEKKLILKIDEFPSIVLNSEMKPNLIAKYVFELAQTFNDFYVNCKCLVENPSLRSARLSLVKSTVTVLKNGLGLLGISAPERM